MSDREPREADALDEPNEIRRRRRHHKAGEQRAGIKDVKDIAKSWPIGRSGSASASDRRRSPLR